MTTSDYNEPSRGGGASWILAPVVLILFLGAALSVGVYFYSDTQLTVAEAMAAGFGGLAGLIIGLVVAAFSIVIALVGALIGVVAAGGAVAMTVFIIASPVIALILLFLLMRRSKSSCPDPAAHQ